MPPSPLLILTRTSISQPRSISITRWFRLLNFTNKTALKTTLSLPVTQLLRTNNLEILFSHTCSEENSQAGTTEAIVQVHGDSYLTWSGYQGPTGQLSDLPHVFLQPGQLIVDTRQPALLAASLFQLSAVLSNQFFLNW